MKREAQKYGKYHKYDINEIVQHTNVLVWTHTKNEWNKIYENLIKY